MPEASKPHPRRRGPSRIAAFDDPLRYAAAVRARCPNCNSLRLRTYRTTDNGDDSLSRHSGCRVCGWRFIVEVT